MLKKLMILLLLAGSLMAALDVNKATKTELMSISGIGEKKAEAILEYRKKHGNFKSIDDLKNVEGIGKSIVENVKNGKLNAVKVASKKSETTEKTTTKK
jgi:competence protein ComEA